MCSHVILDLQLKCARGKLRKDRAATSFAGGGSHTKAGEREEGERQTQHTDAGQVPILTPPTYILPRGLSTLTELDRVQ